VVWEGDDGSTREWTYAQLERETAYAVSVLHGLGVHRGDSVGLCLPMIPETVSLFLACAWLGAIVVPLFSGYGAGAIVSRLQDCDAQVLVIVDGFRRRGAVVPMKAVADEAASQLPSLRHILVVSRIGDASVSMQAGCDVRFDPMPDGFTTGPHVVDTEADSPFMIIYTSGTTGKPKGTVHVHGGFPVKATQDMAHCFDVGEQDRLLWFTDIGWMMGPWAICGALSIGATLVLFDGVPDHPGPDRLWSVVEHHRVTVLGIAPTVNPGADAQRRRARRCPRPFIAARARVDRGTVEHRSMAVVPAEDRGWAAAGDQLFGRDGDLRRHSRGQHAHPAATVRICRTLSRHGRRRRRRAGPEHS